MGIAYSLRKRSFLKIFNKDGKLPSNISINVKVHRVLPYDSIGSLEQLLYDDICRKVNLKDITQRNGCENPFRNILLAIESSVTFRLLCLL
jgi:hypothetical protein